MKDIRLRISKIMSEKKLNNSSLGKIVGYSDVAIGKIVKGTSKPKFEIIQKISEHFPDINTNWLLTGKGTMLKKQNQSTDIENTIPFWNLPVSAGKSINQVVGANKPDGFIKGLPGADIAENILPVNGASMEPEVSNGAIIGVRKMDNWESLNTERIYLIITQDDRMIKRIEHDEENHDILWCVSPNYPRFKVYKTDIIEIQRVCFVYNPK